MKDTTNIGIHYTDKIKIGEWKKLMTRTDETTYIKYINIITKLGNETEICCFKNVPKGEKPND